jgi:UDP-glucose 4-epimerase
MRPDRVLVTGGAGFVGSHLCDALVSGGAEVVCVDNLVGSGGSSRNIDHLGANRNFHLVDMDVVDWAKTADLRGIDCVFHQAASKNTVCMDDPERDLEVNALATLRLLRAANTAGTRKFIHASTGSVFGELLRRQDEDHPRDPVSFYGVSKMAAESYTRAFDRLFDLDVTIFRYYHVIGPRQNHSDSGGVVPIFVRRCLTAEPITIYGTGEQSRSFTSVHDVVKANMMAWELGQKARGTFNCASGIRVSIQDLANFIIKATKSPTGIEYADWRPGDIRHFDIDNQKIRSLGLQFDTDWKSIVRDVIRYEHSILSTSSTSGSPDQ